MIEFDSCTWKLKDFDKNALLQFQNDCIYRLIKKITWTLTKRDRKQLNVSERKVYRRILGPVYDNEK